MFNRHKLASEIPLETFSRWRSVGRVSFSYTGRPIAPVGIFFNDWVYNVIYNDGTHYFGEAFNLRRRLTEHCESPSSDGDRVLQKRIMKAGGADLHIMLQMGAPEVFVAGEKRLAEQIHLGAAQARRDREKLEIDALRKKVGVKVWAGRSKD